MARQESDREDILREATGLIDRIELLCTGFSDSIVFGFRRQGALSLFVGQDEVYQFDVHQALRRGYWQGQLIKAERGRLVILTRQRTATQTCLVRNELSDAEQDVHLGRLQRRIESLRWALREGDFDVLGEVSASGQRVVDRVLAWLNGFPRVPAIAKSPHVR